MKLNLAGINFGFLDYPDSENWAAYVYISGCTNSCPQCHNKHLQDFNYGENVSVDDLYFRIKEYCTRIKTRRITFLGGDPLHLNNRASVLSLCKLLHKDGYHICIYTGYELDNIDAELFKYINYLKTGKYDETLKQESKKTDTELWLSSTNQNMYKIINSIPKKISHLGVAKIS